MILCLHFRDAQGLSEPFGRPGLWPESFGESKMPGLSGDYVRSDQLYGDRPVFIKDRAGETVWHPVAGSFTTTGRRISECRVDILEGIIDEERFEVWPAMMSNEHCRKGSSSSSMMT